MMIRNDRKLRCPALPDLPWACRFPQKLSLASSVLVDHSAWCPLLSLHIRPVSPSPATISCCLLATTFPFIPKMYPHSPPSRLRREQPVKRNEAVRPHPNTLSIQARFMPKQLTYRNTRFFSNQYAKLQYSASGTGNPLPDFFVSKTTRFLSAYDDFPILIVLPVARHTILAMAEGHIIPAWCLLSRWRTPLPPLPLPFLPRL